MFNRITSLFKAAPMSTTSTAAATAAAAATIRETQGIASTTATSAVTTHIFQGEFAEAARNGNMEKRQTNAADDRNYTIQKNKAAVIIQQAYRRHANQKKFGFKQLNFNLTKFTGEWTLKTSKVFTTGNDPELTDLTSHRALGNSQIAIVGTSGLRILSIACELNINSHSSIPKVIVIDNEKTVYLFWRSIRYLAATCTSDIEFLKNIQEHFKNDTAIYHDQKIHTSFQIENGDPKIFLEKLIKKFGFNYVKSIILATVVIKQSWADTKTVTSIRNILKHNDIEIVYAYLSNIISCVPDADKKTILENVNRLNPAMAIHTDFCHVHSIPENVYYLTDHRPETVMQQLTCHQATTTIALSQLLMLQSIMVSQMPFSASSDESNTISSLDYLLLSALLDTDFPLRDDNDSPTQSRSMGYRK